MLRTGFAKGRFPAAAPPCITPHQERRDTLDDLKSKIDRFINPNTMPA